MIDAFRLARFTRILKIVKLIRLIKFGKLLYTYIGKHRGRNILISSFVMLGFLIFIGSVGILIAEDGAVGATIISAEDAIWWSIKNVTTVGYADGTPVTIMGQIIGTVLMIGRFSFFGIFTGSITSWFLKGE